MEKFGMQISKGDTVIEIGGHIGFVSQYFSRLVGIDGKVIVFEPGSNNLPYIQRNLTNKPNVVLESMAVSNNVGEASFYEDSNSGQNNSLLNDYKNAISVAKSQYENLVLNTRIVSVTTVDSYVELRQLSCDFIKIDIEGLELNALLGASKTLQRIKGLMVEVTENQEEVSRLLLESGFFLEDEGGNTLESIPFFYNGNIFALKR